MYGNPYIHFKTQALYHMKQMILAQLKQTEIKKIDGKSK